jgi:hypothetical protein
MSFRSLSIHAFRSLIEYSEDVLALFLKAFFLLAVLAVLSIGTIIALKLFTTQAIPGWASILSVSLINSTLLCLGFFSIGLLLSNSLHRRDRAGRALYRTMPTERIDYIGEELDLFQHAVNWKRYYGARFKPYIRGRVLDAGCGMGVNAEHLWNERVGSWTFLEPDPRLLDRVPEHVTPSFTWT